MQGLIPVIIFLFFVFKVVGGVSSKIKEFSEFETSDSGSDFDSGNSVLNSVQKRIEEQIKKNYQNNSIAGGNNNPPRFFSSGENKTNAPDALNRLRSNAVNKSIERNIKKSNKAQNSSPEFVSLGESAQEGSRNLDGRGFSLNTSHVDHKNELLSSNKSHVSDKNTHITYEGTKSKEIHELYSYDPHLALEATLKKFRLRSERREFLLLWENFAKFKGLDDRAKKFYSDLCDKMREELENVSESKIGELFNKDSILKSIIMKEILDRPEF